MVIIQIPPPMLWTPIVLPFNSAGVLMEGSTAKVPLSLLTKPATNTASSPPATAPSVAPFGDPVLK